MELYFFTPPNFKKRKAENFAVCYLLSPSMNILIFSITYFPFVGGAEIAVKEITDRIGKHTPCPPSQEGNYLEFDLITAKLDKKLPGFERIGNVNVYRVGRGMKMDKYLFPLLAYFKANDLHKEKKYDAAQAIMANYAGLAALLFKLKNKNVKYLLTEQSGDSDFFIWIRTWFWYPLYRMIYTKADYVQAISSWLGQRVRRYGYRGEIKIVPNGVDVGKFQISNPFDKLMACPEPVERTSFKFPNNDKYKISNFKNEFRKKLGINEDAKFIITVSRLVKKNGVEDLIKAMGKFQILNPFGKLRACPESAEGTSFKFQKNIKYQILNFKLLIAGTGKLENKLRRLVEELELQDRVIFLGHVGHNELPKYLWAADIFCRPSLTEGFGNVFVEAMAAGLPVIATPVGGIPDFLIDGETGVFCKVRNPKSIADAAERLLNDKVLYDKIAANGSRLVEERYDWDGIAEEMVKIYRKLLCV